MAVNGVPGSVLHGLPLVRFFRSPGVLNRQEVNLGL